MKHLVPGIVIGLAICGAVAALVKKSKADAEEVEEVIPEMDFDNIINLHRGTDKSSDEQPDEQSSDEQSSDEQLSDAELSAMNDVATQITEKESVNPADLVEKTRKKTKISDKEE